MIINKFTGKTEDEAKAKARESLGNNAIIMNVKEVRGKGILGIFKGSTYEVTAAIEDDSLMKKQPQNQPGKFNALVDDEISIPPVEVATTTAGIQEETLRDVFRAVEEVRAKSQPEPLTATNSVASAPASMTAQSAAPTPSQKASQPTRTGHTPAQPSVSKHMDTFEPLSAAVPTVHFSGEATYSKPEGLHPRADMNMTAPSRMAPTSLSDIPMADDVRQLEERLSAKKRVSSEEGSGASIDNDNHKFVKMLYNVLLENEVQEKYINQVLEDMDRVLRTSHSLDNLLSSVYQKMVLKLGQPKRIMPGGKRTKVVFFIGPTGVGKTTTIAKIASRFKVDENRRVGLITADTYRMAAADQLRTYANILGAPMSVIYSGDELNEAVKRTVREYEDVDTILVDTIGFSHKNQEQKADMKKLLDSLDDSYDKEVYLVLSTTTKYKDLLNITDSYMEYTNFSLIFTKLDETSSYGNIYNIKLHTGASLSYVTTGQNVPDDIDLVNPQKLVKQLLGGN